MRKRLFSMLFGAAFIAAACGGGGATGAPTTGTVPTTGTGATSGPAGSTAPEFDPSTSTGEVTLGQWESSPAEGTALKAALDGFAAKYPKIKVTQTTIAGDYRAQMVN